MFELPKFMLELMSDMYLGDTDITFTNARTKGSKLLLATEVDFPGGPFWHMQGELALDLNDGSVDLTDEDPGEPSLIVMVMNATSIGQLPSTQVCKSEFVRWLAELKMEELKRT